MRFLSLSRPPKNRLTPHGRSSHETEWLRQWWQIKHRHHCIDTSGESGKSIVILMSALFLLLALFWMFT